MCTTQREAAFFLRSLPRRPGRGYANAIVLLYLVSWLLGAVVYLYFKVDIQPDFGTRSPLACDGIP